MNLRQARLKMIRAVDGGWDVAAALLGMSRDALENRIYERRGQSMRTDEDLQLQKASRSTFFTEAVCAESGGTFVKLPNLDHVGNDDILNKMNELHIELGQWSATLAAATKDGEIDKREEADLSAIMDEIHRTLDEIRALTFRLYRRADSDKAA